MEVVQVITLLLVLEELVVEEHLVAMFMMVLHQHGSSLLVAVEENERERLQALAANARACGVDDLMPLDGTTLRARYTTPDGASFTVSPPDVRYEWHSPAFTAPLQGPEITLDLSVIDTALLAGLERLPVELRAVDTVRGVTAVDLRELLWDPASTPSARPPAVE